MISDQKRSIRRLLFVCIENSNRSQMAEAFVRIHGEDHVEVYSSGSRPSGEVNAKAVASMQEVGYDLSGHRSKGLSEIPQVEYDYVIAMGCGEECPSVKAKRREEWDIPDPKEMKLQEFQEVRDLIERKVKIVLANL